MKTQFALMGAIAALAIAAPASAATVYTPGDGTLSLTAGKGSFTLFPTKSGVADFQFNLSTASPLLAGSLSSLSFTSQNFVTIKSVVFDGTALAISAVKSGSLTVDAVDLTGLKTLKGINDLIVTYTTVSHGVGSFSGSFTAAVPEPTAWALMLVGVGVAGVAMRRKQRSISQDALAA